MFNEKWKSALLVTLLFMQGMVFAQPNCLFVSNSPDPGDVRDLVLIEKLYEWGYEVDIIGAGELTTLTADDYALYDFAFLSETPNSSDFAPMRGHPLPIFTTEAWGCAKPPVLGWAATQVVRNIDPEPILIMDETNHPLAAGFPILTEIELVSGTDVATQAIIPFTPTIDVILIAPLLSNEADVVICGVEPGTILADDSTVVQNRGAVIGIHADAYNYITEDGYALIKAGVEWVLNESGSAVEIENTALPERFTLEQNYPNPFNPTTEIEFSLTESEHTTLTIYNALGQRVRTLIDQELDVGTYKVQFDGQRLPSGIYYYKLQSGQYSEMKKMALMK